MNQLLPRPASLNLLFLPLPLKARGTGTPVAIKIFQELGESIECALPGAWPRVRASQAATGERVAV